MKKRAASIVDVARHAGVSPSTVSRALSGTIPVAADTQAAILEAIDQLGYRPNHNARGLVKGNSMVVGVLTQDIASSFFGAILEGIEQGLEGSGYSPMIIPGSWHVERELEALDVLLSRQVDALIVLSGHLPDERIGELADEMPLVMVGRSVAGREDYCLQVDNFQGAYLATQHLISLGHRKIAHVAGPFSQSDAALRREGYCQALKDAGITVDSRLILECEFSEQAGLMAIEAFMKNGTLFSAIFAANDQLADGCLLGLSRHRLRVPDDISLVGFDDQPGSAYTLPPLTTVRQPTYDMGYMAAKGVLSLLRHEELALPQLTTQLMIRESTARRRSS